MTGATICFQSHAAARARGKGAKLPDSPDLLVGYHRAAGDLLAMLAGRVEPDWQSAEAALAEIERLIALQAAIRSRVAARPAGTLNDVLAKLTLWSAARDPEGEAPEDALVASALCDLQRLLRVA